MCGLMSDLVICKFRKVWSYMTLNVLTETRCHETTQTQILYVYVHFFLSY